MPKNTLSQAIIVTSTSVSHLKKWSSYAALMLLLLMSSAYTLASDLDLGFSPSTNGIVNAVAVQADGKIILAGSFTSVNGETNNRIARLLSNGELDDTFTPPTINNGAVLAIAIQSDGKIVLGGTFTTINNTVFLRIARLQADGTLDTDFDPLLRDSSVSVANLVVSALAIQVIDGEEHIVIGGDFERIGGSLIPGDPNLGTMNSFERSNVARLNLDGSLDASFANVNLATSNDVLTIAIDSQNRILIAGLIGFVDGVIRHIVRLDVAGNVDTDFNLPPNFNFFGSSPNIFALAVQDDNKVLAGGFINEVNGVTRDGIVRFNVDGSLDTTFVPPNMPAGDATQTQTQEVRALALQSNGQILLGGPFDNLGGVAMTDRLARLNPDGSVDNSFMPDLNTGEEVLAIALQANDDIIVGGDFSNIGSNTRNNIARFENTVVPEISFTTPDPVLSSAEGDSSNTPFEFSVSRSSSAGVSSVNYTVSAGATNPATADDFPNATFAQGTLDFANGEFTQTITVMVNGDTEFEADEEFIVTLSNPVNAVLTSVAQARGIIENDDLQTPELNIAPAQTIRLAEGSGSDTTFSFTVSRTLNTNGTSSVNYTLLSGSPNGTDINDFVNGTLTQGTLDFADGQPTRTISVVVNGDTEFEPDEEFMVILSDPVNANLGSNIQANGIIENDDEQMPELNITVPTPDQAISLTEGSGSNTTFNFTVSRTIRTDVTSSVNYTVFGGAPDGTNVDDFVDGLTQGTLEFADGQSTQNISVMVNGDTQAEADEEFVVSLSNPVGANLGANTQARGIILNDDEGEVIPDDDDLCLPITAQNGNIAVICL